ncbi:chymosin-like [Equus quagga]|uniref:chymosin-like n=1 Tax=Equus quagga TaxID=89248 RepID=UPI001EE374B7|nr:chymosin-like [Equus quagga]
MGDTGTVEVEAWWATVVSPGGGHSALLQVSDIVDAPQTEGLSSQEPGGIFTDPEVGGIVGLAYPSLASLYSVPVFDNIAHRHLVARDLFLVYVDSVMVGGIVVACDSDCQAIRDTNTSLLVGPSSNILSIQMVIGATQGQYGQAQGSCASGFQGDSSQQWILGVVFMQEHYSVFDSADNHMGLGKAV